MNLPLKTRHSSKRTARAVNPSHPLAAGLVGYWLFGEGLGAPTNLVTGEIAPLVNSPTWTEGETGPILNVLGSSSQYANAGIGIPAMVSGASRLTVMARVYRASSSDTIDVLPGTSNAVNWGFTWQGTGFLYFGVATGTQAYGNIANTQTGWHDFAAVFDGTQTGNANRLQGYIDGVLQTLSYLNTIPSTVPVLASTQLEFGHSTSLSAYSTGAFDWVGIWLDRALSADEIAIVRREPLAVIAPRRTWIVVPETVFPANFVWANESPADGEGFADLDDIISIDVAPGDLDTVLDTTSATVNGGSVTVTETPIAGGVVHLSTPYFFRFGETLTVEWTATDADGLIATHEVTFTVREAGISPPERTEFFLPEIAKTVERVEETVRRHGEQSVERVEATVLGGFSRGEDEVTLPVVGGLPLGFHTIESVALIAASLVENEDAFSVSEAVGDGFENEYHLSEQVTGEVDRAYEITEEVISGQQTNEPEYTIEISVPQESEYELSMEVGPGGASELEATEQVRGSAHAPVTGEVHQRSEPRAKEEDE